MVKEITNISQLIDHLTKLVAAYRKSYKFCGNVDKIIQIISGLIGSSAILALVPAIPIAVSAVGAVPAVMTVMSNVLKTRERKTQLKAHHRQFKQLLSFARTQIGGNDKETIKYVFNKILELQKGDTFTEPLEMYMKKYKLNGYSGSDSGSNTYVNLDSGSGNEKIPLASMEYAEG